MRNLREIIPVVLCGGKGSRLWPLSNPQTPKHFLNFGDRYSLFQNTVMRCDQEIYDPKPIIVANSAYREMVVDQLNEIGRQADLCLEAVGKNTCPAIVFACLRALERESDPTLLVLPSDHLIEPVEELNKVIRTAICISKTHLVAFGFKPDSPHTGYGYIQMGSKLLHESGSEIFKVNRFVEKPDKTSANRFYDEGYLWNGGIFLMNARLFLEEVHRLQPKLLELAKHAYLQGKCVDGAKEISAYFSEAISSLSVDHGIFELSGEVAVCPADIAWRDIGNWDRAAGLFPKDQSNNSVEGNVEFCESRDNFVHSPHHKTRLVGVDNLAVVVTRDAVLVAHRTEIERTGVLSLQNDEPEAMINMYPEIDHRPWGEFHRIDLGDGYQVKRLRVEPGQSLSLQTHNHRSEHWIVVSGIAEVTIGDVTKSCHVDESVYIPKGSVHRLANKSPEILILIEIQTGDYFGEDDIVRIEDIYDRVKN